LIIPIKTIDDDVINSDNVVMTADGGKAITNYDMTEKRVGMVATQYRESENFLQIARHALDPLTVIKDALEASTVMDIDVVEGDQLTIIGKVLGWPRTACVGVRQRTFGFTCDDDCRTDIGGFCTYWFCADHTSSSILTGEFTFDDDELYRRFLKSLVVKYDNDFRRSALYDALRELFGDDAGILRDGDGRVDIFTGRKLTDQEFAIAHIFDQVLPIALGVSVGIYETPNGPPFGFGDGWGGFCSGEWPVQIIKG